MPLPEAAVRLDRREVELHPVHHARARALLGRLSARDLEQVRAQVEDALALVRQGRALLRVTLTMTRISPDENRGTPKAH